MPDMLVKLYKLNSVESIIDELRKNGIVIRRAMAYEKHEVINWIGNLFGACWSSECDVAFSNHPVSCFIAIEAGKIIGFACYDSTCKNFFGPMGVMEKKRGQGIGRALFLSCLHSIAANGYAYAIIGGIGPEDFYAKTAGAVVIEGSSPGIYRDPLKTENPDTGKAHGISRSAAE